MFGHEMFSSMRGDALGVRQDPRDLDVLVERRAADVDDRPSRRGARSSGSFSSTKRCTPMPCRPIAFSMPGRRLDDARRRMSFALGEEQALDGDAAERRQIDDVGVLDAVAEAAARGDQRVGERQRADLNGEIGQVPDQVQSRSPSPAMHQSQTVCRRRTPARRCTSARSDDRRLSSRTGTTQL